ncbi:hypothetical protein Kpol_1032p9 [Vanderwaltozyma polyspora DSM 70294]|uniref:Uncharacterized protein n=1 Tax=Vanderwaltozyma polyspora (strain ATCC 22028 / DSM 70294 / BCRC 21397 / CBS 2163 / NBRC 10782 / NRRL Y-8283 / UCD 57-17) TaxID=436907 RepID=A7TGW5_VANPO|nr:uncharacterized protein Kpol_1032p9 [Vanderwaltozyma polyspora DSM 70294]EDO18417.1 hypothetical protein Kpol_1032p9 [Vanderwaltozyma polyspora DSM 70294]
MVSQNIRRRSITSTSSTVTTVQVEKDGAKSSYSYIKRGVQLVTWEHLPDWQKDNEHILSGYVKETNSIKACLHSLLFIHNESVNIFSHLVPAFCFMTTIIFDKYVVERYPTTTLKDYLMLDLFLFGAFTCLMMSSAFHCLKAHSPYVSSFGNKLDYLGIVVLIVSSMSSILYYGFYDNSFLYFTFSAITFTFGLSCAVVSLGERFRAREWRPYRAAMFVAFGLSALLPIFAGFLYYGVQETTIRVQLKWVVLEGVFYIFGALLYGVRFPERLKPGMFDIWGHSHQLFHILVVVAALCHLRGLLGSYTIVHTRLSSLTQ